MIIGNGKLGKSKFNAFVIDDIANQKVFDEITFSLSKRLTIPSSAVGGGILDIVVDPSEVDCDKLVFLPVSIKAFGAGPVFIDLYIGTQSSDDGTLLTTGNRDNESSNTAKLIWRLNPTISNIGVKTPFEFSVFSDGIAAVSTIGGETREGQIFNAVKNQKYTFRFMNQEASQAYGHIASTWFEFKN